MIFFENNPIKTFSLFLLVFVAGIFVVWNWLRFSPWPQVAGETNDDYWEELKNATSQTASEVKGNIEVGNEQLGSMKDELERQAKADALLQATKEYIESTTTPTSSSQ